MYRVQARGLLLTCTVESLFYECTHIQYVITIGLNGAGKSIYIFRRSVARIIWISLHRSWSVFSNFNPPIRQAHHLIACVLDS